MLAPSSRTTSNVSLGSGTTKFILLLSAIRIVGQRVTRGTQLLDRGLPARAITYTIAVGSRSAPKTRDRAFGSIRAANLHKTSLHKTSLQQEVSGVPISGRSDPSQGRSRPVVRGRAICR